MMDLDCDQLTGRYRDVCRGHDDEGNPIDMPEEHTGLIVVNDMAAFLANDFARTRLAVLEAFSATFLAKLNPDGIIKPLKRPLNMKGFRRSPPSHNGHRKTEHEAGDDANDKTEIKRLGHEDSDDIES